MMIMQRGVAEGGFAHHPFSDISAAVFDPIIQGRLGRQYQDDTTRPIHVCNGVDSYCCCGPNFLHSVGP
jgi:hypothetical protein